MEEIKYFLMMDMDLDLQQTLQHPQTHPTLETFVQLLKEQQHSI